MNPTHAPLSPSKRVRFSRCPGSTKFPDKEDSGPAAKDGTHSHTLLERCIKANLNDPLNTVGSTFEDHEGQFTVDGDRALRVKTAVEYIQTRHYQLGSAAMIYAETRVDPARLVGRSDMSGTFDWMMIGGGICEIGDYKDGMHPVPAERNEQLEQYMAGILAEYPERPYPFTEMWGTIIQPKLAAKGMNPISTWKTTVEDIMNRVIPRLQAEAAATDDPNAPRIPGEVQCKYCPAKGFCPELAASSLASAGISFPAVSAPLDVVEQAAQTDPSVMDGAQIVRILEAAPLLKGMIAAVEEEALKRLTANPSAFNGALKLVAGRGSRNWVYPEEEMAEKLRKLGMPKDTIYPPAKLISPAQAEKAVWEKRDGTKVTLTPKKLAVLKKEYIASVAGKPTVALASDDRPALTPSVEHMFGAVGETPAPTAAPELPAWLLPVNP